VLPQGTTPWMLVQGGLEVPGQEGDLTGEAKKYEAARGDARHCSEPHARRFVDVCEPRRGTPPAVWRCAHLWMHSSNSRPDREHVGRRRHPASLAIYSDCLSDRVRSFERAAPTSATIVAAATRTMASKAPMAVLRLGPGASRRSLRRCRPRARRAPSQPESGVPGHAARRRLPFAG
jgi:hypothetical protein